MRILDCLVLCSAVLLMSAPLCIAPPRAAFAASFDCSQAVTEIEIAICNSESLSELDDLIANQWELIDRSGRYFDEIYKQQVAWIEDEERLEDGASFEVQLDYLRYMNAYDACLFTDYGTTNSFVECAERIQRNELDACEAEGSYTTLAMKICRRAYMKALDTIELVETRMSSTQNTEIWEEYRRTECLWLYDQWGGTITDILFSSCWIELTTQRISIIFNEQR